MYAKNWNILDINRLIRVVVPIGSILFLLLLFGISAFGAGLVLLIAVMIMIPAISLALFRREQYTVENDRLIVRFFFKTYDIQYASIKSVEKMSDIHKSSKYSSLTWKNIRITYTDINGKEEFKVVSPGRIEEFFSDLESRLPDSDVIKKKQNV